MLKRSLIGGSLLAAVTAAAVAYSVAGESDAGMSAVRAAPGRAYAHALKDLPGSTAAKKVQGLPAGSAEPFSLLGVSWDRPGSALSGNVQVRTRDAASGAWSRWQGLEAGTTDAPDGREKSAKGARGGTTALWVGPSNGVEVRVTGKGGSLPAGLRVDLIDPGTGKQSPGPRAKGNAPGARLAAAAAAAETSTPTPDPAATATDPAATPGPEDTPTDTPTATGTATPSLEPSAPTETATPTAPSAQQKAGATTLAAAPRPAMTSRAQWGADETLVTEPPAYDTAVKAAFVHHTDTGNAYTCDQSASVIRSIFLYHVKSLGWADIGYNFLVDKCGTLFEGRAGGADRPVHGAHTYGFNTDTTGIALLGTHTAATDPTPGVAPTQAALDATARIAAWKLDLAGVDPTATTTLTSMAPNGTGGKYPYGTQVSFNTVSGHRDGFATACPGEQLYAKLGVIRTAAKQWTTPTASLATTVTGATKVGTRYYTKSTVTLGWEPAAVSSYELRVDGATVARPSPSSTSATITLAPGAHSVRLHATNADGSAAASADHPVTADPTRPVFNPAATLYLRRNTVNTTALPVTLSWKATDNALLSSVRATSPAAASFATTATGWNATAKPGTTQNWSLTATDAAGNATTSAASRYSALVSEFSATRTGTWKTTTTASYLGGKGLYSSSKGASASWKFTGRTMGLIVKRASNLGAVIVYVDGVRIGTLDTRSSTTAYRQLIWTRTWSASGTHTVKIVVAGTSGRPTVGIDGIAYLR
ncbi:peptidoglycan recognition protein [Actinomadura rugatobispora]|uniref:Peptidoglycan recognition protein n=1 Tax=Actinomadura rugatobispora TaxID=1994 RepID=A0ABW1AEB1_9ACTN|nr:hypothetical protein GCM10010200_037330 [Actinomadura rugatobispora]